jgi:hypothetical protein
MSGGHDEPIANQRAGARVSAIVEDASNQSPRPGRIPKLPPIVLTEHPERRHAPAVEPAQNRRPLDRRPTRHKQRVGPLRAKSRKSHCLVRLSGDDVRLLAPKRQSRLRAVGISVDRDRDTPHSIVPFTDRFDIRRRLLLGLHV